MRSRRHRKRASLPLPFEDLREEPLPVASAQENEARPAVGPPALIIEPSPWSQMTLWMEVESAAPEGKSPSAVASLRPAEPEFRPKPPSHRKATPESPSSTAPPPARPRPKPSLSPARPSRRPSLDDESAATAAESLGIDLEALRRAATDSEFGEFRRWLRQRVAERVKRLRNAPSTDPFDWDAPALAAVPALVEDRAAVEALYLALRPDTEPLRLPEESASEDGE